MLIDAHVHVVGSPDAHPLDPARSYLPGPAPLAKLRASAASAGIDRFVLVQPSFYGCDNTLLMQSLGELGPYGRGVAVVDLDCEFETLSDLARCGVRGLRVNLYSVSHDGKLPPFVDTFHAMVDMAGAMQWHVEVIASMASLAAQAEMIASAGVDVVFDHYGLHGNIAPDSAEGRCVLELMRLPHVWMKLSAPYRCSADEHAVKPDPAWLDALVDAAPARCVWGSDWPFTPDQSTHRGPDTLAPYRDLTYDSVVDGFRAAIGDAELTRKLMRDNAARLYGFSDEGAAA